jgi:hypothetical protein
MPSRITRVTALLCFATAVPAVGPAAESSERPGLVEPAAEPGPAPVVPVESPAP